MKNLHQSEKQKHTSEVFLVVSEKFMYATPPTEATKIVLVFVKQAEM